MCRVDLSDVQARSVPEGLNPSEKMVAVSMPRRSSARRAQLLVEKTRINVPYDCQSREQTVTTVCTYRIAGRGKQLAVRT